MAALNDADRTTRSRLSNPRTRRHLLRARIAELRCGDEPWGVERCHRGVVRASRESERFVHPYAFVRDTVEMQRPSMELNEAELDEPMRAEVKLRRVICVFLF